MYFGISVPFLDCGSVMRRTSEHGFDTPHGEAVARLFHAADPRGALVLGHGAGGGIEAPDLVAVTSAAADAGWSVALVLQPYRVAGKKSSPVPAKLDEAWAAVTCALADRELAGLPLVTGGRSAGARVACRTASATGSSGVLCLAFPLRPPPQAGKPPGPSRLPELEAVEVPVLIVQGENDRFGMPEPAAGREVVRVAGDHGLKKDHPAVAEAVVGWLDGLAS
jgi:predicted alpha/beta-hydrolase family hydrolase